MKHKTRVILISVAVLGVIILAGVAGVSIQADETTVYRPNADLRNDRANHHPVHPNN